MPHRPGASPRHLRTVRIGPALNVMLTSPLHCRFLPGTSKDRMKAGAIYRSIRFLSASSGSGQHWRDDHCCQKLKNKIEADQPNQHEMSQIQIPQSLPEIRKIRFEYRKYAQGKNPRIDDWRKDRRNNRTDGFAFFCGNFKNKRREPAGNHAANYTAKKCIEPVYGQKRQSRYVGKQNGQPENSAKECACPMVQYKCRRGRSESASGQRIWHQYAQTNRDTKERIQYTRKPPSARY